MRKQILPKRFFTLSQLAERWECTIADVEHCIDSGDLRPTDKGAAIHGKDGQVQIATYRSIREAMHAMSLRDTPKDPYFDINSESDIDFVVVAGPDESFIDAGKRAAIEITQLGWGESVVMKAEVERFEADVLKIEPIRSPAFRENSVLAVVATLLASWPKGDIPGCKDLEKAAESIGVKISDDSIRKVLAAAADQADGDIRSSLTAKLRRQQAPK